MRYSIKLSYDGGSFCGWQIQPGASTVQECLEKALTTLLKTHTTITGAGRTDSKVNAVGYVAHFDMTVRHSMDTAELGYKLNAILPRSIVIHSIEPQSDDFHARFDAKQRKYTYFLHRTKDPFIENYSYRCEWPLDIGAMNEAAAYLLGRHDFSCFEKTGTDNKTSVCEVTEAFWAEYSPTHVSIMGFSPAAVSKERPSGDTYLYFRISADRFLRNMVRAVVGTLIEVGRGKRSLESFKSLILPVVDGGGDTEKAKSRRSLAGESVPGNALFLSGVDYRTQK